MKTFVLIFIFVAHTTFSHAQNYGYTYLKLPLVDYVNLLLSSNNDNTDDEVGGPIDGLFINTGYAFKIKPNIYLETGIDYLLVNTQGSKYFKNQNPQLDNNVLEIENSVLGIQFRPLWRIDVSADDNAFFFAAMGFNFQKQFTIASFTNHTLNINNQQYSSVENTTTKSNFYWATQPEIGLEYRTKRQLGFRFGISYSYINWNLTESKLKFNNNPSLNIEAHRTSNLFFSFGFVY